MGADSQPARAAGRGFAGVVRWFRGGFELLSRDERAAAAWLTLALAAQGLLDAVAVSAVVPFVAIVVEPGLREQSRPIQVLESLLGASDYAGLVQRLASVVLLLLMSNALASLLLQYRLNLFASRCQTRLGRELLQECVAAPYSWFLSRNPTSLARFFYDDVSQWSRGFVQRLMTMANAGITAVIGTALILAVAPKIGLLTLIVVGGAAVAALALVRPRLQLLAREKRASLDRTLLTASQVLSGIKDVKLSSRSDFFVRLFAEAYRTTGRTHARLSALQLVVPTGLPVLGQVVLVAVGLLLIAGGQSRGALAGQMALLVLASARVVPAISQLSSSIALLWNVNPYLEAIRDLRRSLREAREQSAVPSRGEPWNGEWERLSLVEVGYQYPAAEVEALRGVALELKEGRAYGVAGPSGAGKSTLVDLILGLLEPTSGEILLDGRPLSRIDRAAWQGRIGYVAQSPYLADDTLRANVAFGVRRKDVDDAWVRECLETACLADLLADLGQGLDTPMGDRGARVSGGQRQRIAIARALYNRPRLLVLDEATSALDRISENSIQAAIAALHGRLTTLTIAHRLATIRHCDTIFLLERGQLAAEGRFEELLASSSLFRQMATDRAASEAAVAAPLG